MSLTPNASVIHGDCIEMMNAMPPESVDAIVTPPGGTVLDPFAGSGATIEAAIIEGFSPIGIELEAEYLPLIQHRIDRQAGDES